MQTGKGVVSGAEHCGHVLEVEVANLRRERDGEEACEVVGRRRRALEGERLDTAKDDGLSKAAVRARRNMVAALRLDNRLSHIYPADVM